MSSIRTTTTRTSTATATTMSSLHAAFSLLVLFFARVASADFLISFHGGSGDINNLHLFKDSLSDNSDEKLLPDTPEKEELRGFVFQQGDLYVVSANYKHSDVLRYSQSVSGDWEPVGGDGLFTSDETVNGISHPFQVIFDDDGNGYVSSQDSNVVTKVDSNGVASPVAPYLLETYPDATFLEGTWVASATAVLPRGGTVTTLPPNVTAPQGLEVSFENEDVHNSVRGIAIYKDSLFVSDEPSDAVKVYDLATGELKATIEGDGVVAKPDQLLIHNEKLYIASLDTSSIVTVDLATADLTGGTITPVVYIDGQVERASGMTFDDDGNFYVAERVNKKIYTFDENGENKSRVGEHKLNDEPEFIMWIAPKAGETPSDAAADNGGSSTVESTTSGGRMMMEQTLLLSQFLLLALFYATIG